MLPLILAAAFFPLSHFVLSSTVLRRILVRWIGPKAFSLCYSLVALGALIALVAAYRAAPRNPLWTIPEWMKWPALGAIALSLYLIIAGLTTPNPIVVAAEKLLHRPGIVQGILRVTRHPFMWGASLFSLVHLLLLGELAGTLAFGSVAILGLAGVPVLDAKKALTLGAAWRPFADATSSLPFLAIVQGRQRVVWRELGTWRFALAFALSTVALLLHPGGFLSRFLQ